jgi:hypothetical protein
LKKQARNTIQKCYQLGSLLLVLLFLSITVVQAFHRHDQVVKTEQSSGDEDTLSSIDDCQLCDYFTHKQGKQLFFTYPPVIVLPLPEPISYSTAIFLGNYKFTLQGFTNKGPPVVAA